MEADFEVGPLRQKALAGFVLAAAMFLLYLPAFGHALDVWRGEPELSFGIFGPPGAVLLLVTRRGEMAAALGPGSRLGLPLLVAGLLMLVVGQASGIHAVSGLSLFPTCLGAAAFVAGIRFATLISLPVALLTATISLYIGLLHSLGFWLQQLTAIGAAGGARMVGTAVVRSGVDLFVGDTHFVVTQACSGMSSLLALLYLGMMVAAFVTPSWPARALMLASAVPIVLIANVVRVTLVLVTSSTAGVNLEAGTSHAVLSAAMFLAAGLVFVLMAASLRRLRWLRA